MFGFLFQKKRDAAQRLLSTRMNSRYLRQFRLGDRSNPRGSFCEVVWLIPYAANGDRLEIERAYPAVTKDISADGLALIHDRPLGDRRLLIGLQGLLEMQFVLCRVEHSTALGYGFYQIGLQPEELIKLPVEQQEALRQRLEQFEHDLADRNQVSSEHTTCPAAGSR